MTSATATSAPAAYGKLCGWTLPPAHARSGDRIAIASYLGGGSSFDRAILEFSNAYADQVLDPSMAFAVNDAARLSLSPTRRRAH